MAIVAPFKSLTYNFDKLDDISRLITPPYDVISEDEQERYYQADPYNVIRLILGKKKIGDSDWDNRYTRSADTQKRWESEDILVREDYPSMYLTSLAYDLKDGNGPRVRWGLIALVRIEDEGSGVILPHEKTFSAHKDDRLRLIRACGTQHSQIFGFYDDSENSVFRCLEQASSVPPRFSFKFQDGTRHQMWVIQDQAIFNKVAAGMRDKSILIADGHHRYETSRNYRNIMRARRGTRPANRSYEYVMMYLTDMNDEGLTILPSHRLIKRCEGFQTEAFLDKLKQWFEIDELPFAGVDKHERCLKLSQMLEEKGRVTSAIGFHFHKGDRYYVLSLKPGATDEMGDDLHPSLRKLDVLVLSHLILRKGLGFTQEDLDNEKIFHYNSVMEDTVSMVDSGAYEMTFLLNHTKIEHVKEVAGKALIMPMKSTYFYPKVMTGLVFNKIDPNEIIQVT
ncbi:MAG: DUF1015 domain-containing protein [Deltaproteobacteria bacterium]|nr:DUF1015 domain-containing protein [Deltaproteobacteria bacterium]